MIILLTDTILEQVSNVTEEAEIDVLIAIGESYCKYFSMLSVTNDTELIQESFIFMEADSKGGTVDKIKEVFVKLGQYIKAAFSKITGFIQKKFVTYTADIYGTINLLYLSDAIIKANPDEVVTEYEVFEEAMTPAEQKEALKRFEEKKAAVKQEVKNEKKTEKAMFKSLKKNYADVVNKRLLTKDDLNDLVKTLRQKISPNDFRKLQSELKDIQKDKSKEMCEHAARNLAMIDNMYENMVKANKAEQEFLEKFNAEHNWKSEQRSDRDIEMRLELIDKFANTLGQVLNDMTKSDNFSAANLQKYIYNDKSFSYIGDSLKQILSKTPKVVSSAKECFNKATSIANMHQHNKGDIGTKTIEKAAEAGKEYGPRLYEAHKKYDDAVFEDNMKRKELGMKANATANGILFALNQIKEETYGYTDDSLFNKIAYDSKNPIAKVAAGYLAGPFTMLKKTILTIVAGPAYALKPGISDMFMYIAQRTACHTLNKSEKKIVSNKEAYKDLGKHSKKAMKNMTHEEKMEVINKAREEKQKEYDEKKK